MRHKFWLLGVKRMSNRCRVEKVKCNEGGQRYLSPVGEVGPKLIFIGNHGAAHGNVPVS